MADLTVQQAALEHAVRSGLQFLLDETAHYIGIHPWLWMAGDGSGGAVLDQFRAAVDREMNGADDGA